MTPKYSVFFNNVWNFYDFSSEYILFLLSGWEELILKYLEQQHKFFLSSTYVQTDRKHEY